MKRLFWNVELLCVCWSSSGLIVMHVRTESYTHPCAKYPQEQILSLKVAKFSAS